MFCVTNIKAHHHFLVQRWMLAVEMSARRIAIELHEAIGCASWCVKSRYKSRQYGEYIILLCSYTVKIKKSIALERETMKIW